jgi:hypothetical protein
MIMLMAAVMVNAVDVGITQTKVNGVELLPNSPLQLDIESGGSLDLEIEFVGLAAAENVEVFARLSGNDESAQKTIPLLDVQSQTKYTRTLSLELPDDFTSDSYQLLLFVGDKSSEVILETYNLAIRGKRHHLVVNDVLVRSMGNGYATASARIRNVGYKDQKDVRVNVAIPELGVSTTTYMDWIASGEEESTQEMMIAVPDCVETKTYAMTVRLDYNKKKANTVATREVLITDDRCPTSGITTQGDIVASGEAALPPVDANAWKDKNHDHSKHAGHEGKEHKSLFKSILECILLLVVGLAALLALVVGATKLRSDE